MIPVNVGTRDCPEIIGHARTRAEHDSMTNVYWKGEGANLWMEIEADLPAQFRNIRREYDPANPFLPY